MEIIFILYYCILCEVPELYVFYAIWNKILIDRLNISLFKNLITNILAQKKTENQENVDSLNQFSNFS